MWSNIEHFKVVDKFESEMRAMKEGYLSAMAGDVSIPRAVNAERNDELRKLRGMVDDLKTENKRVRHYTNIEVDATNRTAQMFNERNIALKSENTKLLDEIGSLNNRNSGTINERDSAVSQLVSLRHDLNDAKQHVARLSDRPNKSMDFSHSNILRTDSGVHEELKDANYRLSNQRSTIQGQHSEIQKLEDQITKLTVEATSMAYIVSSSEGRELADAKESRDNWQKIALNRGDALKNARERFNDIASYDIPPNSDGWHAMSAFENMRAVAKLGEEEAEKASSGSEVEPHSLRSDDRSCVQRQCRTIRKFKLALKDCRDIFAYLVKSGTSGNETQSTALKGEGVADVALEA